MTSPQPQRSILQQQVYTTFQDLRRVVPDRRMQAGRISIVFLHHILIDNIGYLGRLLISHAIHFHHRCRFSVKGCPYIGFLKGIPYRSNIPQTNLGSISKRLYNDIGIFQTGIPFFFGSQKDFPRHWF